MGLVVALVVIVIPLAWIIVSIHQSNSTASRALSATAAETGLLQLTRDLREASPTSTFTWDAAGAAATFSIPIPGAPSTTEPVTWSCSFGGGICTRRVGGGTAVPEIKNVISLSFAPTDANGNALASPATNPAYVGITLQVQNASSLNRTPLSPVSAKPITLADGAYLRNGGS